MNALHYKTEVSLFGLHVLEGLIEYVDSKVAIMGPLMVVCICEDQFSFTALCVNKHTCDMCSNSCMGGVVYFWFLEPCRGCRLSVGPFRLL